MQIKGLGAADYSYKLQNKPKENESSQQNAKVDTFEKTDSTISEIYQPPKRLTAEQVEQLKMQVQDSMKNLAKQMLGEQYTYATKENGSIDFAALAKDMGIGTTPEEAAEAISEDGNWGVNAVATRLMDMAIALSGGDSSKAEELREAVKKGFEEVGALEDLPQVCQDTYNETMKRFDYWAENGSMEGYSMSE